MALNVNAGSMNTSTHSSTAIRQMDPAMYQRMAMAKKAAFVSLLRLATMKANAKKTGRSGFAYGKKAKNCKSYKYEWEDFFAGSPLSSLASTPTNPTTDTSIAVASGDGKMFQPNDLILDRNTGEQMLVTAVSTDTLTVVRGWGTTNQGTSGTSLASSDVIVLLANAWSEGSFSPIARSYNPTTAWNYCQIFKRAVENTGTNEEVEHYGNINKLSFQKQEEWYQYLVERSRAYYKGKRVEYTDSDGKKKRTTAGLDSFITTNIFTRASFTYNHFMDFAEMAYGYGGEEKILICNPALATLIQKEVMANKISIDISPKTKEFGVNIKRLSTIHGDMDFMIDLTMKDLYTLPTGFALELPLIEEMILRPDVWKPNVQANDYDGRKDQILGECGLKVVSEQRHAKIIIDPSYT